MKSVRLSRMARWNLEHMPQQAGRTVVVTGANSGLGYVTTRELARRGAHVIMAVRNAAAGQAARADLLREIPDASIEVRRLDLADLESVQTDDRRLMRRFRGFDCGGLVWGVTQEVRLLEAVHGLVTHARRVLSLHVLLQIV